MAVKKIKKEIEKQGLIEIIRNAQKSISILGATVFNLPWKKIIEDGLGEKFFNEKNDFVIRVLFESESLISQYALLSELNTDANGGYTRGNFNGVKADILRELKEGLLTYAKSKGKEAVGLEPPVDTMKKQLNNIFDERIRSELLDTIVGLKESENLKQRMVSKLKEYFDSQFGVFFKQGAETTNAMELFEEANLFKEEINILKEHLIDLIKIDSFSTEQFKKLDLNYICGEYKTKNCVFSKGTFIYNYKNGEFEFGKEIGKILHNVIISYRIEDASAINANRKLNATKEVAEKMAAREVEDKKAEYNKCWQTKQRLFIKNCYLPMPVAMIEVDGALFITHALTKFDSIEKYQYVGDLDDSNSYQSYWITEFRDYYERYFVDKNGAQKYSTEETRKGDRKEVIDMFDEQRVRIGSGPRDAFLANPSIIKTVVWALIFDRKGRMLIHQRALNAKDNRGLWDKSVGGHVSIEDLDTIEAIRREISEELYSDEKEGQGGHDDVKDTYDNIEKVIYLGEWKTVRYPNISDLKLDPRESYLFSLNYKDKLTIKNFRREAIETTRVLPGGETVKAKCFVDPYLCIVPEKFNMDTLHNSNYALLSPHELRRCVNEHRIRLNKDKHYDKNALEMEFKVTSDLEFLVNSSLWVDVVTEFSRRIVESFNK